MPQHGYGTCGRPASLSLRSLLSAATCACTRSRPTTMSTTRPRLERNPGIFALTLYRTVPRSTSSCGRPRTHGARLRSALFHPPGARSEGMVRITMMCTVLMFSLSRQWWQQSSPMIITLHQGSQPLPPARHQRYCLRGTRRPSSARGPRPHQEAHRDWSLLLIAALIVCFAALPHEALVCV